MTPATVTAPTAVDTTLRNDVNSKLRETQRNISSTEVELIVTLQMIQEKTTHMINRVKASDGRGKAQLRTHITHLRNLVDQLRTSDANINLMCQNRDTLHNFKLNVVHQSLTNHR